MGPIARFVIILLFFLLIIFTGYRLGIAGKPYTTALFTFHKLLGIAGFIFLVLTLYRLEVQAAPESALFWVAMTAGLFFLGSIITGGMISAVLVPSSIVIFLHKMLPWLTAAGTIITIFLVIRR